MTPDPRRGLALGILIFAGFMDLLDVTIVQVALPAMRTDLGADPGQLEWTVSGYMLAFAVVLVTGGRLGDIAGRRTIFLVGVAGFTLASFGASLAVGPDLLVAARVVQGAFAALMVPQLLGSVQALYSPRERAPLYGIIGGVSGLAAVVGPLLGGLLVDADLLGTSWRSIFLLNIPVGVALLVLAAAFVPNTRSSRPLRLDPMGVLLLSAGLLGLLWPLTEGQTLGWPGWLLAPAAAGVALLVLFVLQQRARTRRGSAPLLPLRLFRDRGFTAGLVAQGAFQGAMNAFTVVFLIYLQATLGFSAFGAGLTLLAFSIGAFVGTGAAVPLGTRIGKPVIVAGAALQAGSVLWALRVILDRAGDLSGWDLVPALLVTGIGLGLVVVPLVDVALANVPIADAGAAAGAYSTFQQLGAAIGVAVSVTAFFARIDGDFSPEVVREALTLSCLIASGGYLLCALAALFLPRRSDVLRHVEEAAALAAADVEPERAPART